jgi:hypothetical protein
MLAWYSILALIQQCWISSVNSALRHILSKKKYGLLQGKCSKDPLVWKVSSTGNWSLRVPSSYILLGILEQWPQFFLITVFIFQWVVFVMVLQVSFLSHCGVGGRTQCFEHCSWIWFLSYNPQYSDDKTHPNTFMSSLPKFVNTSSESTQ